MIGYFSIVMAVVLECTEKICVYGSDGGRWRSPLRSETVHNGSRLGKAAKKGEYNIILNQSKY